jgi:hypothetical protein
MATTVAAVSGTDTVSVTVPSTTTFWLKTVVQAVISKTVSNKCFIEIAFSGVLLK